METKDINQTKLDNKVWITRGRTSSDILIKLTKKKNIKKWIYCGKDYLRLIECEKKLKGLQRVSTSELVSQTAWKVRQEYVDWISNMGKPYGDSLRWWTSDLAEKNTMVSDLFLSLCYLDVVQDIVQNHKDELLIVAEDWAFGLALYNSLKKNGFESNITESTLRWRIYGFCKEIYHFTGRWIKGMFNLFIQYWAARRTRYLQRSIPFDTDSTHVFIHTCVDEACLGKDGVFKDRYFVKLPLWLRTQGYNVITIVWPYNFQRPLKDIFKWFRSQKEYFIIPEDYFCIRDYVKALCLILSQLSIPKTFPDWKGKDISFLIWKEKLKQSSSTGKARFLLYSTMIKRIKERGYRLDYFVDMFENMKVEKPVAKAVHEYYPKANILGFQHVTIDPFVLLYIIEKGEIERNRTIFPDRIVCNGKIFLDILLKNGFPQEMLCLGPALRYQYLWATKGKQEEDNSEEKVILVVLPLEMDTAIEILRKIKTSLYNVHYKIAIRSHPMMNKQRLLSLSQMSKLPETMLWAEGDINKWFSSACCVLGSATAAVFEAVLFGVPVVILGREIGLEMNPLSWWQKNEAMFRALRNPEEIRRVVIDFIDATKKEREDRMTSARNYVNDCFQEWDEKLLINIFQHINSSN